MADDRLTNVYLGRRKTVKNHLHWRNVRGESISLLPVFGTHRRLIIGQMPNGCGDGLLSSLFLGGRRHQRLGQHVDCGDGGPVSQLQGVGPVITDGSSNTVAGPSTAAASPLASLDGLHPRVRHHRHAAPLVRHDDRAVAAAAVGDLDDAAGAHGGLFLDHTQRFRRSLRRRQKGPWRRRRRRRHRRRRHPPCRGRRRTATRRGGFCCNDDLPPRSRAARGVSTCPWDEQTFSVVLILSASLPQWVRTTKVCSRGFQPGEFSSPRSIPVNPEGRQALRVHKREFYYGICRWTRRRANRRGWSRIYSTWREQFPQRKLLEFANLNRFGLELAGEIGTETKGLASIMDHFVTAHLCGSAPKVHQPLEDAMIKCSLFQWLFRHEVDWNFPRRCRPLQLPDPRGGHPLDPPLGPLHAQGLSLGHEIAGIARSCEGKEECSSDGIEPRARRVGPEPSGASSRACSITRMREWKENGPEPTSQCKGLGT